MSNTKHVYDGIEEENNPMPDWWIAIFILTIIFGFIYWLHFEFGGGASLKDEYKSAMAQLEKQVEANSKNVTETEETLTEFMKNESALAAGAAIFSEKCAMCHGANLEGKIGPNLTDHFWLHGKGSRLDILTTVTQGVPDKGMPPWGGLLKPGEIKSVAAFVFSKRDSNPPNPKAPQGDEVK